jgi:Asp-tRNA(Asn)/Glu-tRNA(Gln) amidotransferase A subunit family amidase
MPGPSRKDLLVSILTTTAVAALPSALSAAVQTSTDITLDDLRAAAKVAGVSFPDAELKAILDSVKSRRGSANALRGEGLPNELEAAFRFVPLGGGSVAGKIEAKPGSVKVSRSRLSDEDIAFLSVAELSHLLKTRQIRSRELTELYLSRLKRYDPKLLCVVNLTEERALREADAADREIAGGHYRGPLHGIPYGVKDLFAAKGAPTTWGAGPYRDQVLDFDSTVVQKLNTAGAVLVAKLTNGALAMDDKWFGGQTKNPWNTQQGSSGSSAGSASATSAGLVGFGIGTETLGSIVSPSIRCRVTGLRPTYGRVSRHGGMVLAQTMDKVGPICRTAQDTALVLAAIAGSDPLDPSAVDHPFCYPKRLDYKRLKIGVLVPANRKSAPLPENPVTRLLKEFWAHLEPISFSALPPGATDLLDAEAAAAFDGLTRHPEEIAKLQNSLWPDIFRAGRFTSAVDYLNAQRARSKVMRTFEQEFGDFDFFVTVGGGYTLAHTNLTGHPQIVIPQTDGSSISLVGRLYREDVLCSAGWDLQKRIGAHRLRPPLG